MKKTANKVQYQHLVGLMKKNRDIAKGFTKRSPEEVLKFWEDATNELNSVGPPVKELSVWKKVWSDYKSNLKKKLSANKKDLCGTGGGPNKEVKLTGIEEEVVALVCMLLSTVKI